MSETKPREFWVYEDQVIRTVRAERNRDAVIHEIHVIEKSAYDALAAENSSLKAELIKAGEENGYLSGGIVKLRAEIDEQCRINGRGAQRELQLMTELADAKDFLSRANVADTGDQYHCTYCNKTHVPDFKGQTSCMENDPKEER